MESLDNFLNSNDLNLESLALRLSYICHSFELDDEIMNMYNDVTKFNKVLESATAFKRNFP